MDNQNDRKMRKLLLVLFISNICYSQSEFVSLSIEDAVKYGIENKEYLNQKDFNIADTKFYKPPSKDEMVASQVSKIYCCNYFKNWNPQENFY